MFTPSMPNLPGAGAMSDTLDFVKNLWGSMAVPGVGIPGITAPSLSVEDLDKKINDLKAVEAWLNVNLSMLRGTINTLEVQRNTIATLQTMGETLANAVKQPGADPKSVLAAAPFASAFFPQPTANTGGRGAPAAGNASNQAASPPPAAQAGSPSASASAPSRQAKAADAPERPTTGTGSSSESTGASDGTAGNGTAGSAAGGMPAAAFTNPAVWWNMLQDQFRQAVSSTMSPEALGQATAMAQEAARRMAPGARNDAAPPAPTTPEAEAADSGEKAKRPAPKRNGNGRGRGVNGQG